MSELPSAISEHASALESCHLSYSVHDNDTCHVGKPMNSGILYIFAVWSILTASGGLIFGYGPFINRLITENVVPESQSQIIFDNAFQIMTGFTLLWTLHLHHWGPRVVAASGAVLASLGNFVITVTLSRQSTANTVYWLLCGYGLIGGGGISVYLASMNLAHLFPNKAARISLFTAAFSASGTVYILLSIDCIPLVVFFGSYTAYTFMVAVLVMILYPSTAYDGSTSDAHVCLPFAKSRCIVCPLSTFRVIKAGLKTPRFWAFALAFSWETVITTWAQGALLERYSDASPIYKNIAFPLLSNAAYLVNPFIGKVIDNCGFVVIVCINIFVAECGLVIFYFDDIIAQWLSLFFILGMTSFTYTTQYAYLTLAFPSDMFPGLLFVTVVIQFLIDLTTDFLASKPWGTNWIYYLVVLFVPTMFMYVFPVLQYSEEKKHVMRRRPEESPRSTRIVGMARRFAGNLSPRRNSLS